MKKFIGICILVALFAAIFICMGLSIGFITAIKIWAAVVIIVVGVTCAVNLIFNP